MSLRKPCIGRVHLNGGRRGWCEHSFRVPSTNVPSLARARQIDVWVCPALIWGRFFSQQSFPHFLFSKKEKSLSGLNMKSEV